MSDNIPDLVARLNDKHTQSQCGNFVEVHPDFLREAAQALTRIAEELRQVEAENEAERIANAQLFDRAYEVTVERKEITDLYVRICRDSRFTLDAVRAMALTGLVLGIHPLAVWVALPSLSTAEEIASGTHIAARMRPSP